MAVNLRKLSQFNRFAVVEPDGTLRKPTKPRKKAIDEYPTPPGPELDFDLDLDTG